LLLLLLKGESYSSSSVWLVGISWHVDVDNITSYVKVFIHQLNWTRCAEVFDAVSIKKTKSTQSLRVSFKTVHPAKFLQLPAFYNSV